MINQVPDLIAAKTLAAHLSVSVSEVRKMARQRRIPSYPLGRKCRRFRLSEVQDVINRLRIGELTDEERRYARRFRK